MVKAPKKQRETASKRIHEAFVMCIVSVRYW